MKAEIHSLTGKILILPDFAKYILRWVELILVFVGHTLIVLDRFDPVP